MNLIEKLLCKIFPYTDILRDGSTDIYLRRWFVYPRNKDFGKNKSKGRVYLHKFYRGDEDLHLHSHPWKFTSLILTKGYWEETPFDPEKDSKAGHEHLEKDTNTGEWRKRIWYSRFSILHRPATWVHRVILGSKEPVWTLVKTGVKERSWGFYIMGKVCPWRQYNNGNCLVETIDPESL